MTGHRPVLCLGRPLSDRHRIADPAMLGCLLRVVARAAHPASAPQVLEQLLLQGPAGLDKQRAVDRLVGHLMRLVVRVRALEPAGHLPWRPLESQLLSDQARPKARFWASLQRFGRSARSHAAASASLARYARLPPLRQISRLTVLGARLSERAIARADSPAIAPREISSRSVNANARAERRRGRGRIPPDLDRMPPTGVWLRANRRAIACSDSPCRQRSHIKACRSRCTGS